MEDGKQKDAWAVPDARVKNQSVKEIYWESYLFAKLLDNTRLSLNSEVLDSLALMGDIR